ncbi:RtcB family protein [Elioraea tepidiphila]|jgi:tRNA-splicing ligase RtcB|uniref:RtcB family protein n=1 Tax=Elioraea tepidiphila TaxID=457934 RepID=UPI00035D67C1|nr:RtcB family protein [Elioraea tepidiphila]
MDPARLIRLDDTTWRAEPTGAMRAPVVIYAEEALIRGMDDKVLEQARNVATLPGIIGAAYAMPDAHWGYGFPIGGVAAFDPTLGGVVSAGGVGFDISCGVRTMLTGLPASEVEPRKAALADRLFAAVPAGMGRQGDITVEPAAMDALLEGGAQWAVAQGWGEAEDLARIEEQGRMAGADPAQVSERARLRMRRELGTLGSGNHYLEVQVVAEILAPEIAAAYGLRLGEVVVTIHSGSRGLGHQVASEFLLEMAARGMPEGTTLPDRELACAPIASPLGQRYLGAMRAAINCAFANREILGHRARMVFRELFPEAHLSLLFDVSHNTCKEETHKIDGEPRHLFVHRKGATRALGPGHPALPERLRAVGQPVLIGGSMGTGSWVLAGLPNSEARAFASACHGAGRALSRHAALKRWSGRAIQDELAAAGILIRSPSTRGIAEEAPGAYKDVGAVVAVTERAGLARRVARLRPIVCIKG